MKACVPALLAGLVLTACGPALDSGPVPRLSAPVWPDGETATYTVLRNDSVQYTTTITVTVDEEAGPEPGALDPIRTVVITSITEPTPEGEFFFDSSVVVCQRESLRPLRSERRIETSISEFEVTARYQPTRVYIRKQTVDGASDDALAVPRRTYAGDAVQALLRAVPLDPGTAFRANLCIPMEFRAVPIRVQVLGTKCISTGIGDVLCREVSVVSPGREARYWIELAESRRFIGMHDRLSDVRSVLAGYSVAADTAAPAESLP
jgi:hypothetical protein